MLQKEARTSRFSALSADWAGEKTTHLAMLEVLAQGEGGEESTLFKAYVAQQNAVKEQLATSKLLSELGSSAPVEGSISAKVEADIRALQSGNSQLTYEQAFDQVRMALPVAERKEFDSEQRRTAN